MKYVYQLMAMTFCLLFVRPIMAQVGVGTTSPDASAQLEVKSDSKGLLIPRVSSTGAIASPAKGLLVYQTASPEGFYYNSGTPASPVWLLLSTGSSSTPSGAAGGDLSGTYPNPTLADGSVTNSKIGVNAVTTSRVANGTITTSKMADSAVSSLKLLTRAVQTNHLASGAVTTSKLSGAGATSGQVLSFDGTNVVWSTPAGATVADGSITNAKVSSTAAIAYSKLSLTNSIQNGDITANAITTSKVANGTITTSKMADSCVSGLKLLSFAVQDKHIANGALYLNKFNTSGATTGQVPTYNGTTVTWATPAGGSSSNGYGFAANTSSPTIAVVLGGTNIPLPSGQNLSSVTVDGSNTTFTVTNSGTYRIAYGINTTSSTLASTRLLINGTTLTASVISPSTARNAYTAEAIVTLSAGSTINLQFYGLLGAVTLTSGQGAALTIQQLR